MLADYLHQMEDEKREEEIRKSKEVKKFLIKRKKTQKSKDENKSLLD